MANACVTSELSKFMSNETVPGEISTASIRRQNPGVSWVVMSTTSGFTVGPVKLLHCAIEAKLNGLTSAPTSNCVPFAVVIAI